MRSEHKLNWTRKPALAVIGIVILFFVLAIGCDEKESKEGAVTSDTVLKESEEVASPAIVEKVEENKISDISLYFACKPKIQEQLTNPKSFDPSATSLKYNFVDDQHIIGFDFYAKNGFGGEIMQQAICSFDVDGNILEYGVI